MEKLTIVVEDKGDAQLLAKLLPPLNRESTRFFAAQGKMSLATLGRNILVHEGGPLLLILDADTSDPVRAQEQEMTTAALLRHVAGDKAFRTFSFVPEIEAIFFEDRSLVKEVLGVVLSPDQLVFAQQQPKVLLRRILEDRGLEGVNEVVGALEPQQIERLRATPQLAHLIAVCQELLDVAVAPVS